MSFGEKEKVVEEKAKKLVGTPSPAPAPRKDFDFYKFGTPSPAPAPRKDFYKVGAFGEKARKVVEEKAKKLVGSQCPPSPAPAPGKDFYKVGTEVFVLDRKYEAVGPLGKGAFGSVCRAINCETGEYVAIKKITETSLISGGVNSGRRLLREIRLVRHSKHPFIVGVKDVLMPPESQRDSFKSIYIVYEIMPIDLAARLKLRQPITDTHRKLYLNQILRAIHYLHSINVLHRDIKPQNILIQNDRLVKLCDFGLSRVVPPLGRRMTGGVGTLYYQAPEMLISSEQYTKAVDMWSVGCVFALLLDRRERLIQSSSPEEQLKDIARIIPVMEGVPDIKTDPLLRMLYSQAAMAVPSPLKVNVLGQIFRHSDPLAVDLLQKMLVFQPAKRITAAEALRHPYMADVTVEVLQRELMLTPSEVEILKILEDPQRAAASEVVQPLALKNDDPCYARVPPTPFKDVQESRQRIRDQLWDEMRCYHPEIPDTPDTDTDQN